ncbi:MAG: PucR family transcriptional regulator ligand-binding domain-containing protein [Eubacteriales bacterium]
MGIIMGIILREVMNQFRDMEVTLIAGNNGIYNMVTWIHMVENVELATFLEGGELAVTTGIGIGEGVSLFDIVKGAYDNHASGMIINLGPYIEEVTPEILEFANKHDFPVFQVPWKIYMAEIMRMITHEISISEMSSLELETAMKNAIFMPSQTELYLEQLTNKMFDKEWKYRIGILKVFENNEQKELAKKGMLQNKNILQTILRHNFKHTVVMIGNDEIILAMANYGLEEIGQILDYAKNQFFSNLSQEMYVRGTVGGECSGIGNIYKSYQQAKKIFDIICEDKGEEFVFYDTVGIHKLLLAIDDNEVITQYIGDIIDPLRIQDEVNQTDLLPTLKCYLKHSGSVKEAAAELFVHRNTINYKVKKIEELLGASLSSVEMQTKLNLGLLLYDMYAK